MSAGDDIGIVGSGSFFGHVRGTGASRTTTRSAIASSPWWPRAGARGRRRCCETPAGSPASFGLNASWRHLATPDGVADPDAARTDEHRHARLQRRVVQQRLRRRHPGAQTGGHGGSRGVAGDQGRERLDQRPPPEASAIDASDYAIGTRREQARAARVYTGSLTKRGEGTLFVTGTDTWSGKSTVSAGELSVVGSHASPIDVAAGRSVAAARWRAASRSSTDTFALPQALQAGGEAFAPVGGSATPTLLKTWLNPVSNDAVVVAFKQAIGATDPLRMGTYAKTLTFTLSTTTPEPSRPDVTSPAAAAAASKRRRQARTWKLRSPRSAGVATTNGLSIVPSNALRRSPRPPRRTGSHRPLRRWSSRTAAGRRSTRRCRR